MGGEEWYKGMVKSQADLRHLIGILLLPLSLNLLICQKEKNGNSNSIYFIESLGEFKELMSIKERVQYARSVISTQFIETIDYHLRHIIVDQNILTN